MNLLTVSSLRLRLLLGIMVAILAIWALWFVMHASQLSSMHQDRWDASLQTVGQQVLLSMPAVLPGVSGEPGESAYSLPSQMRQLPEQMSIQVWLNDGRIVLRSPNSPATPWVPLRLDTAPSFQQITVAGNEWRVYTLSDAAGLMQVQVGKLQAQLDRERGLWVGISAGTALLLILLLGTVTWYIICWSLSPVSTTRDALLARKPLDLSPLAGHHLPSEVKPLVESFNALLLRLESALQGERRFLADAAHELRTPLAALMAQAQLALSAGTLEESRASLTPLISGIERSARLTEQLLDLARLDSVPSLNSKPAVPLHEIVSLVVRDYDSHAQAARQRVMLHAEPCSAQVDVDAVGVLLRNLLDNAVRYAGNGARIEIVCREQALPDQRCVLLSVHDRRPRRARHRPRAHLRPLLPRARYTRARQRHRLVAGGPHRGLAPGHLGGERRAGGARLGDHAALCHSGRRRCGGRFTGHLAQADSRFAGPNLNASHASPMHHAPPRRRDNRTSQGVPKRCGHNGEATALSRQRVAADAHVVPRQGNDLLLALGHGVNSLIHEHWR